MRASASSSRGSVGGRSFSAFLQLCVYSLRYSCLFCVTRALGMTRNLPPSVKPPLTERIFRKAAYREVTGDFRRDIYPEMAKCETTESSGVWHPQSLTAAHQRGLRVLQAAASQNLNPRAPRSFQSSLPEGSFPSCSWAGECGQEA